MNIFVIHRTESRGRAKEAVVRAVQAASVPAKVIVVGERVFWNWKRRVELKIGASELVVVFNGQACGESKNTLWEISVARKFDKHIEVVEPGDPTDLLAARIKEAYHFQKDFLNCFDPKDDVDNLLTLHGRMLETSEQLIQRRQLTNGFYTTLIGSTVGVTGFLFKEDIVTLDSAWVLFFPSAFSATICHSWSSLIENYGKLNAGKFAVINEIEKQLPTKIFSAEWYALGNGRRPEKYRSFTQTENWIPKFLFWVSMVLVGVSAYLAPWGSFVEAIAESTRELAEILRGFVGE